MLIHRTAAELAAAVADLYGGLARNVAAISMLAEATEPFAARSPRVADAHRGFSAARLAYKDSFRGRTGGSDATWQAVLAAADQLAATLHELGDLKIVRCQESLGSEECRTPLDDDGECPRSADHANA